MKNELGIEVKCENCEYVTDNNKGCGITESNNAYAFNKIVCVFRPSKSVYEARIKELQAQLSNSMVILDEKEIIKTMIDICG